MLDPIEVLLQTLDIETIGDNAFCGHSPQMGWQRVFGGLVVAQALVATSRTVDARPPHSLHGYFMLPGDPSHPIIYEVDRIRDGASFTTRRCNAIQHGRAIFSLSASFQKPEAGLDHSLSMPGVPQPEDLASETELSERFAPLLPEAMRRWFDTTNRSIDIRPVDPLRYLGQAGAVPVQYVWLRTKKRLPDSPDIHNAVLAYLSDMCLLDTALITHGRTLFDPDLQIASLDHALWFHRPFRADEWLLYAQDSPNGGGGRGLTRGLIYAHDGRLVASVAQEGLIRVRPAAPR
ncbi:MAG: acyl-CoA thioesterase II [Beijerinckiaceae bacterium]|nr:MAG: acyl-CoA thioesterase II [Beijerinckiaceae bacterium]